MRWIKHGRIFDPTAQPLPKGCFGFAQSPQVLAFDDFVRIYFSTRAVDDNGKFRSHVAFADFEADLKTLRRVGDNTVMPLGELGAFDEHGIFPLNPLRVGDKVYAYTTGWTRRVSVSVDTGIGLAISSDDGLTFQRHGSGPVLSASLHEPCLVGDGFVLRDDGGKFHMWYIFGTGWKRYAEGTAPDRTYKIGHATSQNGIDWTKEEARQIIPDALGPDESQALPTVVRIGARHHMFFCYRESYDFRTGAGRGYRIGHAWSDDLAEWTRDDANPALTGSPKDWDSDMQCYPHVFAFAGKVWLLYNGNAFGRDGFGLAELET